MAIFNSFLYSLPEGIHHLVRWFSQLAAVRRKKGYTQGSAPQVMWTLVYDIPWTIDVPSGYVKIAIENGPSIVDLPIEHGDFL